MRSNYSNKWKQTQNHQTLHGEKVRMKFAIEIEIAQASLKSTCKLTSSSGLCKMNARAMNVR